MKKGKAGRPRAADLPADSDGSSRDERGAADVPVETLSREKRSAFRRKRMEIMEADPTYEKLMKDWQAAFGELRKFSDGPERRGGVWLLLRGE